MSPTVVVTGGTTLERRFLAFCFNHQLHGLSSKEHPLAVQIVSEAAMRQLALSGGGDVAGGDVSGQNRSTGASDTPSLTGAPDAASNTADDDGIVDAIYTEADVPGAVGSASNGAADQNRATITLLKGEDQDDFEEAFLHEYGHHIWFTSLFDPDRARFKKLFDQAALPRTYVSDYASVSPEEDFAEAFAYYELNPKLLWKRDAAAARIITDLLARLKEANSCESAASVESISDGS